MSSCRSVTNGSWAGDFFSFTRGIGAYDDLLGLSTLHGLVAHMPIIPGDYGFRLGR
nr:MAG TPA: Otospiralin [Caudoviricetes sp.]